MAAEPAGPAGAEAGAEGALRAFFLADSAVFDQAEYDRYRAVVGPNVAAHGGTFIVRGGRFERLEGTHAWHRLIGLVFPSLAAARAWYHGAEYQELKAQRLRGARTDAVLLEETPRRGGAEAAGDPATGGAAAAPAGPPAYLLADIAIRDVEAMRGYTDHVAATHAAHGGRYLSSGGATQVLEGAWRPQRLELIEFPSWEAAQRWYASPEHQALAAVRRTCSDSELVLVEGWSG